MTAKTRIDRLEQKHKRSTTTAQDARYTAFWAIMSCEDLAVIIEATKGRLEGDYDFDLDDDNALRAELDRLQKVLNIEPSPPPTPVQFVADILQYDPEWEQVWIDRLQYDPKVRRSAQSALDRVGMKWPFNFQ